MCTGGKVVDGVEVAAVEGVVADERLEIGELCHVDDGKVAVCDIEILERGTTVEVEACEFFVVVSAFKCFKCGTLAGFDLLNGVKLAIDFFELGVVGDVEHFEFLHGA